VLPDRRGQQSRVRVDVRVRLFFSALGVGLGHQTQSLIAQGQLGVAEEVAVGRSDQSSGHLENDFAGSVLNAVGEFAGLLFLLRGQFWTWCHEGSSQVFELSLQT
jgi:hypothetical protein